MEGVASADALAALQEALKLAVAKATETAEGVASADALAALGVAGQKR